MACSDFCFSVMPILFNGNILNSEMILPDRWEEQELYIGTLLKRFEKHSQILMWDVMNEPACNDFILKSCEKEKEERWNRMLAFLRHHCQYIKNNFPSERITIGHMTIQDMEEYADLVDVISFHDYSSTGRQIDSVYQRALQLSKQYEKPLVNSELCCLCRGNPYDLALERAYFYQVGWYIFELMIDGYWGDIHGIFYSDGTVRDPAIVAAVMGIFRNRNSEIVPVTPNKEGHVIKAIEQVKEALQEKTEAFCYEQKPIEVVLEAAEYCANLLEGCQLIAMNDLPSRKIIELKKRNDLREARKYAYELACLLKKACKIL